MKWESTVKFGAVLVDHLEAVILWRVENVDHRLDYMFARRGGRSHSMLAISRVVPDGPVQSLNA
jgi:hypothetical protein